MSSCLNLPLTPSNFKKIKKNVADLPTFDLVLRYKWLHKRVAEFVCRRKSLCPYRVKTL